MKAKLNQLAAGFLFFMATAMILSALGATAGGAYGAGLFVGVIAFVMTAPKVTYIYPDEDEDEEDQAGRLSSR